MLTQRCAQQTVWKVQGSLWELVQRTQAHSRFDELYKLPAYEQGWQRHR